MAEVSQINFSLREITEMLIRQQKLKSGKWMVGFELGVGIGLLGSDPTAKDIRPGALLTIGRVTLNAAPEGMAQAGPVPDFIVDAGTLPDAP